LQLSDIGKERSASIILEERLLYLA